ncbi:MAG: hypothetical protein Q4D98_04305 [Planctomycetia bacterium]|nr:hypothetical protein [Planctomycetia bacterium]
MFVSLLLLWSLTPDASSVETLVQQLNAPAVEVREQAEKSLLEMGPELLPLLPDAKKQPAEIRLRLSRIRIRLEGAKSIGTLTESKISSPPAFGTLTELLGKIQRETGNTILPPKGTVVTDVPEKEAKQVAFWPFFDTLCDALKLDMEPGKERVWQLVRSRRATLRQGNQTAYLGPFRMEPIKMTTTVLPTQGSVATQMQLELAWEPRLMPIYGSMTLDRLVFSDGTVAKLLPRTHELPMGKDEIRTVLEVPLSLEQPKTLREQQGFTVSGTFEAVVAGPSVPFTFEDLESKNDREFAPVSRRTAGVLVTLTGLRTEENSLVATIRYRYEETYEAMESHRLWVYDHPAWLADADGEKILSDRYEMLRQTNREIAVDLYFPMPESLAGKTLVYPRADGIYKVAYPFTLSEIPLP